MRVSIGDVLGCLDQCLLAGPVAVDEAHCRDEVHGTS